MDWYSEFQRTSKKEWLDKIRSENPESYETLKTHKVFEKIEGLTFPSFDDLSNNEPFELKKKSQQTEWKTGIEIICQNVTQTRLLVNHALENGATFLYFKSPKFHTLDEIGLMFQDVLPDMVDISVEVGNEKDLDLWLSYKELSIQVHCDFSLSKVVNTSDWTNKDNFIKKYTLQINNLEQTREVLGEILEEKNLGIRSKYFIELTENFLTNIAFGRALKKFFQDRGLKGEVVLTPHRAFLTNSESDHIIRFSVFGLAAAILQPEAILLPGSDPVNESSQGLRRSVHLLHILSMESHMNWVNDPAKGSYYIEDLTNKIFETLSSANEN